MTKKKYLIIILSISLILMSPVVINNFIILNKMLITSNQTLDTKEPETTEVSDNPIITTSTATSEEIISTSQTITSTSTSIKESTTSTESETTSISTSTNISTSESTTSIATSEEVIIPVKTTKEQNAEVIAAIRNQYGFDIFYGDDTYCYYGSGECTPLYDEEKVKTSLETIQRCLANFPNTFFNAFQGYIGYHLVLMDDIPDDTAGFASYEMPGSNGIYLDVNTTLLSRVFYHETFHMIDRLLTVRNNDDNVYSDWSNYNPTDFSYGDNSNTYTVLDNEHEPCFISTYAKTNEREDRAEVFADLMFRPYQKDYMKSDTCLNRKAQYLVIKMRSIWGDHNYRWEKWITW